ncbi:unnamed protein product [Ixodes persulcatus]
MLYTLKHGEFSMYIFKKTQLLDEANGAGPWGGRFHRVTNGGGAGSCSGLGQETKMELLAQNATCKDLVENAAHQWGQPHKAQCLVSPKRENTMYRQEVRTQKLDPSSLPYLNFSTVNSLNLTVTAHLYSYFNISASAAKATCASPVH